MGRQCLHLVLSGHVDVMGVVSWRLSWSLGRHQMGDSQRHKSFVGGSNRYLLRLFWHLLPGPVDWRTAIQNPPLDHGGMGGKENFVQREDQQSLAK